MHLTLHLTTACKMQCDYCYAPPHAGAGMSLLVARQALELGTSLSDYMGDVSADQSC